MSFLTKFLLLTTFTFVHSKFPNQGKTQFFFFWKDKKATGVQEVEYQEIETGGRKFF
jgi:hypothetical protein